MRAATLAARRSRVRGGLLLAMFAVVTIVVFLLTGMVGYLAGSSDAAVRQALTAGPPTAAAVQLETRLGSDRDAQTDATGQLIAEAFTESEVTTHRTVRSNPVAVTVGDHRVALILAANPELEKWATLVDGAWPDLETSPGLETSPDLKTSLDAEPAAIALQADAAEELGLSVGDELAVEGRAMFVAATWLPENATDPYWFADSAAASGFDGASLGPAVIVEDELARLPVRSYVRWTIVPEAVAAEGLPLLAAALDSLTASVDKASGTENLELTGGLAERISTVQRGLGAASGLVAVPLVLVGVIGLITLGQLARLLVAVRRRETALLRARGASVMQLTVLSLGEAAVTALPGSALGAAMAIGLLRAASVAGTPWLDQVGPIAFAGAGAAVLVGGAIGWHAAVTAASGGRGDSGRSRTSVTIGTTVLVLVAAAVSLWQFKLYGSPLVAGQNGSLQIDPVTVVAPALTLLALAMLGLLAFAPAVAVTEKLATRGRGIFPVLPSRQVARRVSVFGVAVLLITLSVGGTTLAAMYSQSWAAASATAAQARNGADVRVRLSPPPAVGPGSLVTTIPYLRLPGASDAATVLSTSVRVADDTVGLIAIAADRMPGVMSTLGGSVPIKAIAERLTAEPVGFELGKRATELRLTVSDRSASGSGAGQVESFAWLEDADGSLARISLGVTALAEALVDAQAVTGVVPEGRSGQWRVLAVEATLSGAEGARGVEVTFSGLEGDYTVTLSSLDPSDRAITFPERAGVPVVVSDSLASRLSLTEGDTVSLRIPSTASSVEARVVGTTPTIPGVDNRLSLITDLPTLNAYLLQGSERIPQPSEVWITTDAATDLSGSAALASHSSASVTTLASGSNDRLVAPAIVALWWGMAGALLLAVIAVLAVTTTFVQDRRGEVVVLRALGLSSSEQGKNRLIELATVLGAALLFGALTGLVAAALTVGELANTAVGSVAAVPLRFDVLGWTTLVFAAVAALVTVSTSYAGRVAGQARDTEYREETR